MKTDDFDYYLPEELIAQTPIEKRDEARLLTYDRAKKQSKDLIFKDLYNLLNKGDVLVLNNTRVIPARLYGTKKGTGARIEFLLLKRLSLNEYEALAKPGKKAKVGCEVVFSDMLSLVVEEDLEEIGGKKIRFIVKEGTLEEQLSKLGEMPLPPYIKHKLDNPEDYQTVYSKIPGSSAAPTAGLHFTDELLSRLKEKGVIIEEVLLDVGLGTFRPVAVEDVEKHHMHSERIVVSKEVADRLNKYKAEGKRIIAVGTTSVRTLESAAIKQGVIAPCEKETDIFIYPGYKFKFVDAIITNFHLPKSTLIMLVSAFAGRKETLKLYESAVEKRYRFFSFGDAMFIY